MKRLGAIIGVGAVATLLGFGAISGQYADLPGFDSKLQMGRTKNAVAALVAGTVAHDLATDKTMQINLEATKSFWPDAGVSGHANKTEIYTKTDLLLTSATYTAHMNGSDMLEGKIAKSEFNYGVQQKGPHSYHIGRFALKFDSNLVLNVANGKIDGVYARGGPHFNWKINGTYDKAGHVDVHVNVPFGLDFGLEGTITPQ